ncbi:MAG: hypothetical protein ABJL99_26320 [Aliishimia sp.]
MADRLGQELKRTEEGDTFYSHPDVMKAAAFALPCPQFGEMGEAGVVLKNGIKLDGPSFVSHCLGKVGRFKAPDQVNILDELPKGPSGKIERIKLAAFVSQE